MCFKILEPTPCPCCKLLEEDRNFYRDIVLGREVTQRQEIKIELPNMANDIPIRRGRTLSSVRRQAEEHYRNKKVALDSVPATVTDLTEAERQFNTALESSRNGTI